MKPPGRREAAGRERRRDRREERDDEQDSEESSLPLVVSDVLLPASHRVSVILSILPTDQTSAGTRSARFPCEGGLRRSRPASVALREKRAHHVPVVATTSVHNTLSLGPDSSAFGMNPAAPHCRMRSPNSAASRVDVRTTTLGDAPFTVSRAATSNPRCREVPRRVGRCGS